MRVRQDVGEPWSGPTGSIADAIRAQSDRCLAVYAEDAKRVLSDANLEITTAEGGYGRKQIYELIQNGADALLGLPGRIEVVLADRTLYVANQGRPVTEAGVVALLGSHLSQKRATEIGRFGLGFKSVVAVSDSPAVYSRSGSFGFDRSCAETRIRTVVPDASRYPVLRLAEPLDPVVDGKSDIELASLMSWATTIVKLPLKQDAAFLAEDLERFPAEFLLFSPHVAELDLAHRSSGNTRRIRLSVQPQGELLLQDGSATSRWRVVHRNYRPSTTAAKDAGELAGRESIALHWAVPMQNRSRIGQFWAFFPTESQTTLSGILNAPWKLSDDRRNLLEGVFNREILVEVLPQLLAESLPSLVDAEDAAGVLDLLPARGKEPRNWADRDINRPVYEHLLRSPSLPDLNGDMRRPRELLLHPDGLKAEWLELWRSCLDSGAGWVHHGVDRTAERRSKAERLMGVRADRVGVKEWIEALCSRPSLASSAGAITLVSRICAESPELREQARSAKVLLLEDGRLVAAKQGTVFVRASGDEVGYDFIDAALVDLPGVRSALAQLGIKVLDRSGELRNALSQVDPRRIDWDRVWGLCRQLPAATAKGILREALQHPLDLTLRVRNAEGKWLPMGSLFLGGGVVPLDGSRDRAFLIDPNYHKADTELLRDLGAVTQPGLRAGAPEEPWLSAYRDNVIDLFVAAAKGAKPARDRVVAEGPTPPWPLDAMSRLSSEGRRLLTESALMLDSGDPWVVRHLTVASYGRKSFAGPVTTLVRRHGMLQTGIGPWPVHQTLRPDAGVPEQVLPVADVSLPTADRLKLLSEPSEFTENTWVQLLRLSTTWPEDARRYELYSWAVHFVAPPASVRVRLGNRLLDLPPGHVAVTNDADVHRSLLEQQTPSVLVRESDDVTALIERWGMAEGARMLQQELVAEPVGEPVLLVDRFPALRLFLETGASSIELQLCRSVSLVTATPRGQVSRPVPGALVDGQVLVTSEEPARQLEQVSNALKLDLTAADIRSVLDQTQQQKAQALIAKLRAAASTEERIALAVGADALRRAVPAAALEAVEGESGRPLTDVELAQLAHSVHGVMVLQHFKSVLEERGLNPPVQWAGRTAARRFVNDLGFPSDYAGFAADRRPAVFDVEGPAVLGPLHDFQLVVTERIKALLAGQGPARGLVSLPTGAGKTRVAVQALVDELRAGRLQGPVLWIAQSDELCEQAVQTWAYVWRAVGPRERMAISRFWSGNEVTEETDAFQLVVATTDKLYNAVGKPQYEWMTTASVVVVDEAHTSVAASYTSVLEWLGRGRSRASRRPLLGLTATPFRNTNLEETKRLAARYDGNRLDDGAFRGDPYEELQAREVLARVEHEVLDGVDVGLTVDELQEIDKYKRLPGRVESRLGDSIDRNRRIVRSVVDLPDDWPVLLFATSVENARALAAQLTHAGVRSVAISADTEPAARRHYIEQFQDGVLRVITNYGVLAQGFDAPAVRAVYVTRPTFSTNLYQQMIGRGLRGPKNGGSEQVRIVNVRDNLQQYGDRLAFYDFEHLWAVPVA